MTLLLAYALMMATLYLRLWRHEFSGSAYARVLPASLVLFALTLLVAAVVYELLPGRPESALNFLKAVPEWLCFPMAGLLYAEWLHRHRNGPDMHFRGALVTESGPALRSGRRSSRAVPALTLAGVDIPGDDDTKHFKLIGVTGTGKSTAIAELLTGALGRGDRALIADPDGGYLARFYKPERGDVILNPFDSRSVTWDLFGEIREPYDIDNLSHSLIAEGEGTAQEWRGYARVFLAELIRYCHGKPVRDIPELSRLVAFASNDELRKVLAGTPAQPFLDPEAARMFASLRSVCTSSLTAFRYLKTDPARSLGIHEWVRSGRGVLFLPYSAGQIAALANVIATWVRLGIFETMNRTEPSQVQQALWFVIDELDALGRINGLEDALARLRKFGGRCILGFQSIAQVSGTYSDKDAKAIVENCGNTLILRCSSSERGGTAEFASHLIGLREVLRTETSTSHSSGGVLSGHHGHTSHSRSVRQVTESAVMPSQIEQLPDLTGYLKLSSQLQWQLVSLQRPA